MLDLSGSVARASALTEGRACGLAELEKLYEAHASFVRDLAARLLGPGAEADADDITQEAFLVAMRRSDYLDKGIAERAWLAGIVIKLVQASRRRARIWKFFGLAAPVEGEERLTPLFLFERREASRVVYAALNGLSEKKRTVSILCELQDLTAPEVAQAIGCSPETVRTRLFHARREFARQMQLWKAGEDARAGEQG